MFYRDKILIWRVLNHGFFHDRRAMIWGVHTSLCPCYNLHQESIEHLFYSCFNLHRRWATIAVHLSGSHLGTIFCKDSLWSIIHAGVLRSRRSPVPLVIILEMLQCTWRERNDVRYRGSSLQVPIRQLLLQVTIHAKELMSLCHNAKKLCIWRKDIDTLVMAANQPGLAPPTV